MAPGSPTKCPAGVPLLILLVGLLLPSCLVSGQNTTANTTQLPTTTSSGTTTPTTTAPITSSTMSPLSSSSTQPTTTSSGTTTPTTTAPITSSTVSAVPSSSTSGAISTMNSTSMISCPLLKCNSSDCFTTYSSWNITSCPWDSKYCQVLRQTDMYYMVSCTASCMDMCTNTSQTNCSSACCNSTACLNATFAAMMMMTTMTTVMPETTPAPTTSTTPPATTPDNRNKCHTGTCSDKEDCYKSITTAGPCTSEQKYCQLKKELVDSKVKWTSGCTTNCSSETWCTTSTTTCLQECCLSAKMSCLFLNGTMNVPSSATRGPRFHVDLIVLLICLLVVSGLYI